MQSKPGVDLEGSSYMLAFTVLEDAIQATSEGNLSQPSPAIQVTTTDWPRKACSEKEIPLAIKRREFASHENIHITK